MTPFQNKSVANAFDAFEPRIRKQLLLFRELIFDVASATKGVGPIEETLKWGEPAYLTSMSKSGSTIRLGFSPKRPKTSDQCAIYFNCNTNLVETFRTLFSEDLLFEGNRALLSQSDARLTKARVEQIRFCIAAALTYHRDKAKK